MLWRNDSKPIPEIAGGIPGKPQAAVTTQEKKKKTLSSANKAPKIAAQ